MPNIASVLKSEITRLARKEVRDGGDGLRKTVAAHRAEIASLKKRVSDLESMVKRLPAAARRARPVQVAQMRRHRNWRLRSPIAQPR